MGTTTCEGLGDSRNECNPDERYFSAGRVAILRKAAVVFAAVGLISSIPGAFENVASASGPTTPPFTECPAVGYNASCTLLVDVTTGGIAILKDNTATAGMPSNLVANTYDGVEDTLIGVVNNSSTSLSSMVLSSNSKQLFGFDNDGICQDRNSTSGLPGLGGTGSTVPHCGPNTSGSGQFVNYNNIKDSTGYGGPNAWFTNISSDFKTGTVNFITPIPPGGTGYFSLEQPLDIPDFCQDTITLTPASVTSLVGGPAQTFTATILDLGAPGRGHRGDVHRQLRSARRLDRQSDHQLEWAGDVQRSVVHDVRRHRHGAGQLSRPHVHEPSDPLGGPCQPELGQGQSVDHDRGQPDLDDGGYGDDGR